MTSRFEPDMLGYATRSIEELIADPDHGLFIDPGLGKTLIALLAFRELQRGCDSERMLVIAPKLVCQLTWPAEIEKWAPLAGMTYQVLTTKTKQIRDVDVTMVNPEALPWLFGKPNETRRKWIPGVWDAWVKRGHAPDMCYVDELHRFKRAGGERAKTLLRYRNDFWRHQGGTGSPSPNGYEDLHGQLLWLDGGVALPDTITEYRNRYFNPRPVYWGTRSRMEWDLQDGAAEEIQAAIAPRITCMQAKDWIELPEIIPSTVTIQLPPKVRKQYNEMHAEAIIEVGGRELMFAEEATNTKLRQICGGHLYTRRQHEDARNRDYVVLHDRKIRALKERLEYIGKPTLVIYEYDHDRQEIQKALRSTYGSVPVLDADVYLKWNRGELPVVLSYPTEGLNLQEGGHHIIWYTPPHNFLHYDQMNRRLVRRGQRESAVFVHHICAADTVEQRICRRLVEKQRTEEGLKDGLGDKA